MDGRWFPWGNRFDPSLCNLVESRREGEDVVVEVDALATRFPADESCYGVRGLGGNVRDWTSTEGSGGRDTRVVRGGAWNAHSLYSRCAYRVLDDPTVVAGYFGFRVVRGPRRTRS